MKIAVYAIAKNENAHAERFMRGVKDADMVIVADTGSTDNTKELLSFYGARVYSISLPTWRFDHARNLSLSFVPSDVDVCVCLDLDEVPQPGWREAIERAWTPGTTALEYLFHWSHKPDGTPDISFWPSKVHARHGYSWDYPVHEILAGPKDEVKRRCDMVVDHWQDWTKSRSQYLPLLELSARERPDNQRAALYLGREYMYEKRWAECVAELKRYLTLDGTWYVERCAAMRFIARAEMAQGNKSEAHRWYLRAAAEAPDMREPWIELGNYYLDHAEFYPGAYYAARQALKIEKRPDSYLTEAWAWNQWPEELAEKCFAKLRA